MYSIHVTNKWPMWPTTSLNLETENQTLINRTYDVCERIHIMYIHGSDFMGDYVAVQLMSSCHLWALSYCIWNEMYIQTLIMINQNSNIVEITDCVYFTQTIRVILIHISHKVCSRLNNPNKISEINRYVLHPYGPSLNWILKTIFTDILKKTF